MADRARHPVAHGGLWNTPQATYSKETQNMLKEMMRESKLTNFQQRQLDKAMKDGGTLPNSCHPTSSAKPRQPKPTSSKKNSKIVDPRTHNIQIRTQDQIVETGAYERDMFQPKPQSFYEKDKQRLANIMAFGQDLKTPNPKDIEKKWLEQKTQKEMDRFEELQKEIEERRQFLDQMESIGKGPVYRTIIATEISQKIREMEVVDKKRSAELEKLIAEDMKRKQSGDSKGIPQAEF